ncbi:hypothetical protein [Pantoea ananatis]|uniref:hypothetical protein n=1 Tax=Pantoea ananas TaxID=553 RepID=UPI003CEC0531
MVGNNLIRAYFSASESERIELLKFIKQFGQDNRRPPLKENMDSFVVNESLRKSQNINFAPMQGGCPVCGK